MVNSVVGPERLGKMDVIMAGDDVTRKKPDPLIYNLARERVDLPASKCVVVEDSLVGQPAALGADMPCLITPCPSSDVPDFMAEGAKAVMDDRKGLGDGEDTVVTLEKLFPAGAEGALFRLLRGWRVRRERWLIRGEMRKSAKNQIFIRRNRGREKPRQQLADSESGAGLDGQSAPRGWRGRNERRWRGAPLPSDSSLGMRTHGGSTRPQKVHDFIGIHCSNVFGEALPNFERLGHFKSAGGSRASSTVSPASSPSDMAFPLATASGGVFASAFRRPRALPREPSESRARARPASPAIVARAPELGCSNRRVARAVGRSPPQPPRRSARAS